MAFSFESEATYSQPSLRNLSTSLLALRFSSTEKLTKLIVQFLLPAPLRVHTQNGLVQITLPTP